MPRQQFERLPSSALQYKLHFTLRLKMLLILNEAKVLIKSQSAKRRNKFNTSLTLVANQKAKSEK